MENDYIKEKINSIRCEMNYFWTGTLVTFGGAAGFCTLEHKNMLTFVFIVAGFTLGLIFLNAFAIRRIELVDNLKKIKKEAKK